MQTKVVNSYKRPLSRGIYISHIKSLLVPSLSEIITLAELLLACTVVTKLKEKILTKNDSVSSSKSSSTTWMDAHSCVSPTSKVKVDVFKGKTSVGTADHKYNTITMSVFVGQ